MKLVCSRGGRSMERRSTFLRPCLEALENRYALTSTSGTPLFSQHASLLGAAGLEIKPFAQSPFNGPVALIRTTTPQDLAVTIDWGDSSQSQGQLTTPAARNLSPAAIPSLLAGMAAGQALTLVPGNWYLVAGVHTYATAGQYALTISIGVAQESPLQLRGQATVQSLPAGTAPDWSVLIESMSFDAIALSSGSGIGMAFQIIHSSTGSGSPLGPIAPPPGSSSGFQSPPGSAQSGIPDSTQPPGQVPNSGTIQLPPVQNQGPGSPGNPPPPVQVPQVPVPNPAPATAIPPPVGLLTENRILYGHQPTVSTSGAMPWRQTAEYRGTQVFLVQVAVTTTTTSGTVEASVQVRVPVVVPRPEIVVRAEPEESTPDVEPDRLVVELPHTTEDEKEAEHRYFVRLQQLQGPGPLILPIPQEPTKVASVAGAAAGTSLPVVPIEAPPREDSDRWSWQLVAGMLLLQSLCIGVGRRLFPSSFVWGTAEREALPVLARD